MVPELGLLLEELDLDLDIFDFSNNLAESMCVCKSSESGEGGRMARVKGRRTEEVWREGAVVTHAG